MTAPTRERSGPDTSLRMSDERSSQVTDDGIELVALLGTSFARMEHQGTRWRFLLRAWAKDPRIRRLVAVDFPKLSPRHLLRSQLAAAQPSWLDGCELVEVRVPALRSTTLLSGSGWARAARATNDLLGPAQHPRLAVAATPLAAPLLSHLAARPGFDAVDDWRALTGVHHLRRHVTAGYASLERSTSCTSVSDPLARTLERDFGLNVVTVSNGVDLSAYAEVRPAPPGLPDSPFAVYVGVIQERFDFALLDQLLSSQVPVVIAGPASDAVARRLEDSRATWLGPIDVNLVPGLLQRATVGILPHVVDPLTASMDPMKLLEYLAAGLRVVSTPVARSVASDRLVEATGVGFVNGVREALRSPRSAAPDPAVAARDWAAVARRVLAVHAP